MDYVPALPWSLYDHIFSKAVHYFCWYHLTASCHNLILAKWPTTSMTNMPTELPLYLAPCACARPQSPNNRVVLQDTLFRPLDRLVQPVELPYCFGFIRDHTFYCRSANVLCQNITSAKVGSCATFIIDETEARNVREVTTSSHLFLIHEVQIKCYSSICQRDCEIDTYRLRKFVFK